MFEHLQRLQPKGTATYPLVELDPTGLLDPTPSLTVKPATEVNRPYQAAIMKTLQEDRRMRRAAARGLTATDHDRLRSRDRELYAKYVLVGWVNVLNDGRTVEFSPDVARAFLEALPDWMMDELRAFCSDPTNFCSPTELTGEELEDLGNG